MSDASSIQTGMTDSSLVEKNVGRIVVRLNGWALHMAARFNGAVYLVGSVLHTPAPRDIDIRIVIEDAEFATRYGMDLHRIEFDEFHPKRKRHPSLLSGHVVKWDDDPPTQRWVDDCAKIGAAMCRVLNHNVDIKVWPDSYWREPYPTPLALAAPSARWWVYNKYHPDPSPPVKAQLEDSPGQSSDPKTETP